MVVYDQSTRDVTGLAADSFLSILLGKLDSCFHSVSILTGRSPGLPLHLLLQAKGHSCLQPEVRELWLSVSMSTLFPSQQWLWWRKAALHAG